MDHLQGTPLTINLDGETVVFEDPVSGERVASLLSRDAGYVVRWDALTENDGKTEEFPTRRAACRAIAFEWMSICLDSEIDVIHAAVGA